VTWLAWPVATALAAEPAVNLADLRPVAADTDAPVRFAAWRASSGLAPEGLACEPTLPKAVLLCFRVWEKGSRRWVTTGDLQRWGTDLPTLRAALQDHARAKVAAAPLVEVEGAHERYLRLVDGDGWAAAGLLAPDAIALRLGGTPVRVSFPAEGVLVAYRPAGPELDRILAVGARELYDTQQGSVSPAIFTWDGRAWTTFSEALPTSPPGATARPSR
jgi:hypothetical protein